MKRTGMNANRGKRIDECEGDDEVDRADQKRERTKDDTSIQSIHH